MSGVVQGAYTFVWEKDGIPGFSSAEDIFRLLCWQLSQATYENTVRNGKDYALLIATDRYDDLTPLNNPIYDATTIKNDLEELYGFEVKLLTNPQKARSFKR